jgi:hypothetical protein
MAIKQNPQWLDGVFVQDVTELERLGNITPRTQYVILQMSAVLRRLAVDEQPLAQHAASRCSIPLVILVPEPMSGNPRYETERTFPPAVMKYAPDISERSCPPGVFHCPYTLQEYLDRTHMVLPRADKSTRSLKGRAITPREMILFFANKLGGVHADKNLVDIADGGRSVDAETLHNINNSVSMHGQEALFHQFGFIAERVWRACAPLRDELAAKARRSA